LLRALPARRRRREPQAGGRRAAAEGLEAARAGSRADRRCQVRFALVIALALVVAPAAHADPKKSGKPGAVAPAPAPKGPKAKSYDFGGLDIDGRLRTPQLLYFLNRMKSEFDTTTPDKKSFMPELQKSGDEL